MRLENGEVLFRWPLAGPVVVTAGWFYNDGSGHSATDLRAVVGTPVYAAEGGGVDEVQDWRGGKSGMQSYGNMIRLRHDDYAGGSLQTRYAHLSKICVGFGQAVKEGDLLGYSGETGNCFGAHLHFEVLWRGRRCNPLCWLDGGFTAKDAATKAHLWGGAGEHSVARPDADKPAGKALQRLTIGPVSAGDAMAVWQLCQSLRLEKLYRAEEVHG